MAVEQGVEADEARSTSELRSLTPVLGGPHSDEHERVSRAWTRRTTERRTKHAATPPTLWPFSDGALPGGSWSGWALWDSSAREYRGRPVAQLRSLRVRSLRHQSTWTNLGVLQRCPSRTARDLRRATPSMVASSKQRRRNRRRIWRSRADCWRRRSGVRGRPSNKGMKLTKPGELWSFAAYPRCWADLSAG